MNKFLASIGDLFTKDIPAGLKVAFGDIVHLGHVIGAFLVGGALPFFMSSIFPSLKGQLMIDLGNGGLTPAGVVTALTSATLTALWTLALKAPSNSIIAQIATNLPEGAITTKIGEVSTDAGNAVANAIKKTTPIILAFLVAGSVLANPIGVPLNPPASGENDWLVMPFTNINTYTTNKQTNYGLGLAYGIAFANVQPVLGSDVNITPYFFVAPYFSFEVANWINAGGLAPWTVDYGVMVGLPKIDSTMPEIGFTLNWNSATGNASTLGIMASFPTDVLADVLVRKLNL